LTATIRLAAEQDAESVLAIYAPFCSTPVSFEEQPPAAAEMRRCIARTLEHFPWLVCADRGEILGYVYAHSHRERPAYRWSVEVSVYVGAGRRRSGVGRALYTSLFEALALQGFYNAYAGITLPNPGSVGLHEALGFQPVGVYREVGFKCGVWHDVGWWQRELQPRPAHPEPPRALPAVLGAAGWEAALAAGLPLLRLR
jgi:phosphinothricin acetyltransferase